MKIQYFIFILVVIFGLYSCQKDDDLKEDTTDKIKIDSLIANYYTVMAWDTTTITCYATGDSLTYSWECDHGNFNGSGTQIRYAAGQCCVGINTVICSVSNHFGVVSDEIKIEVTPYIQK